jgi:hypothetical protein
MGIRESSEWAAKKLLRWGFANAETVTPVGQLVDPGSPLPEPTPMATPSPSPEPRIAGGDGRVPSAAAPGAPSTTLPIAAVAGAVLLAGALGAVLVLRRR